MSLLAFTSQTVLLVTMLCSPESLLLLKNPSYLKVDNILGKKHNNLGGNFSYVKAIHKSIVEVVERRESPELFLSSACCLIRAYLGDIADSFPDQRNKVSHNPFGGGGSCLQFVKNAASVKLN